MSIDYYFPERFIDFSLIAFESKLENVSILRIFGKPKWKTLKVVSKPQLNGFFVISCLNMVCDN